MHIQLQQSDGAINMHIQLQQPDGTINLHIQLQQPDGAISMHIQLNMHIQPQQSDADKPCCFPDVIKWHFLLYTDRYNEIAEQNMHMTVSSFFF